MAEKEEDDHQEEYFRIQSDLLKQQGNEAFAVNDFETAIRFFSQAIDIDPDNHILFSNRSAAYLKISHISKALKDAEVCVQLQPNWSKGYSRLGSAQQSLKRFDAALSSFRKAIELEPNNSSYWSSLKSCQEAIEKDRQVRYEEAAKEREIESKRQEIRETFKKEILKKDEIEEEDLMASFFDQIKSNEPSQQPKQEEKNPKGLKTESISSSSNKVDGHDTEKNARIEKEQEGGAEADELISSFFEEVIYKKKEDPFTSSEQTDLREGTDSKEDAQPQERKQEEVVETLTEKYVNQDLGDSQSQVDRLTGHNYTWKNLNPYYVLQLDTDATEEDLKYRYKKLSLKVHPDRFRGIDNAREAFEQVKEAYQKLMDAEQRKMIVTHIEQATSEFKKERRRLLSKGVKESDLPEYEEGKRIALMKYFAEMEHMRRKSEHNRRNYSAREKMQEADEEKQVEKKEEFEKKWSEENRREKRVGNWREFQDVPEAKKARPANYKEEQRDGGKHGKVQLETWKKAWK